MQRKTKHSIALLMTLIFTLTIAFSAMAATTGYVTLQNGEFYEYDLNELTESYDYYSEDPNSPEAELFKHYMAGKVVAEVDSEKGYMDYDGLADAYDEGKLDEYKQGTPNLLPPETKVRKVEAGEGGTPSVGDPQEIGTPPAAEITITSVEALLDINVAYGTAVGEIALPTKVTLNLSDGTTADVDATFACATYDENVAAEYVFTATYELPEGVTGDKPAASVKVIVAAKEDVALAVESVSAITKTGVDVEFKAIEEAMPAATVEVKDNNGNIKEVKPVALVAGETVATFDFVDPLGADPKGVWTVNGVKYDFAFEDLLADVNGATSDLKLYNALVAIGAENVDDANAAAYFASSDFTGDFTTLKEIQAFVDKVNKAQVVQGDFDEWKDAVEKLFGTGGVITNNVQFLNLLKDFDRVNSEALAGYQVAFNASSTTLVVTITSFEDVQEAIDGVNLTAAGTDVTTAEGANAANTNPPANIVVERDAYNDAVKALGFVAPDEEDDDTKAKLEERVAIVDKVLRVFEAKTPAQFASAYNALVVAVNEETTLGEDPFYEAARQNYIDELDRTAATTPATVKTAITDGNAAAQLTALTTISGITAATKTDDVLKALQALDKVTEKGDFDVADVKTDKTNLEKYRTALAAITSGSSWTGSAAAPTTGNEAADIVIVEAAIDGVNNPSGAAILDNLYGIVQGSNEAADADELWEGTTNSSNEGLETLPAQFNAKKANKAAYFANIAEFAKVIKASSNAAADEAKVIDLTKAINTLEDLRAAKIATDARVALSALALNNHVTDSSLLNQSVTDYIDLASANKLEFAEYVMAKKPSNVLATEVAAIFDGGYVKDYSDLISDVNTAGPENANSISDMTDALGNIGYKAFNNLEAGQKMLVAEAVLEGIPYDEENNVQTNFKTLVAIKAAIDTAIAGL